MQGLLQLEEDVRRLLVQDLYFLARLTGTTQMVAIERFSIDFETHWFTINKLT